MALYIETDRGNGKPPRRRPMLFPFHFDTYNGADPYTGMSAHGTVTRTGWNSAAATTYVEVNPGEYDAGSTTTSPIAGERINEMQFTREIDGIEVVGVTIRRPTKQVLVYSSRSTR